MNLNAGIKLDIRGGNRNRLRFISEADRCASQSPWRRGWCLGKQQEPKGGDDGASDCAWINLARQYQKRGN